MKKDKQKDNPVEKISTNPKVDKEGTGEEKEKGKNKK